MFDLEMSAPGRVEGGIYIYFVYIRLISSKVCTLASFVRLACSLLSDLSFGRHRKFVLVL